MMTDAPQAVNGHLAPLRNVGLFTTLVEEVKGRPVNLPGIGVFLGPPGLGKSCSAVYAANKHGAAYVECRSTWTKRALCLNLLNELGVQPAANVYEMVDQIAEKLVLTSKPVIIDEADHLLKRTDSVEVIRDIYEASQGTIILIGEEHLDGKLKRWERFHSRVLRWVRAEFCDFEDARHLRKLFASELAIKDDLLRAALKASRGSARRVCINLELIKTVSAQEGWRTVDASLWGERSWHTGEAPARPRAA